MLEVKALEVLYDGVPIIEDASFSLARGERVAVVGRNGVGKSSLLKAVLGFVESRGEVSMAGQRVVGSPDSRVRRFGFGYLPQERRVSPSLKVEDNLRLSAYNRPLALRDNLERWIGERDRMSRDEIPWSSLCQLEKFLRPILAKRAGNLSGGEQAIVGVSCALLSCSSFMFLDEPSAGTSDAVLDAIYAALMSMAKANCCGLLFVEQSQEFIMRMASSLLWLRPRGEERASDVVRIALPQEFQEISGDLVDNLESLREAQYGKAVGRSQNRIC